MTARRRGAQHWLAAVVCGVAFAMWQRRRRQRARQPRLRPRLPIPVASSSPPASAARPAWLPPASVEDDQPWALPSHATPQAAWLRRASVAIHLGQASELARIGRELDAAGYPAAAGVLGNYALLLERTTARSRILVEVTRLLSTALAEAPNASPRSRGRRLPLPTEAPTHQVLANELANEAPSSNLAINPPPAGPAPRVTTPRTRELPSAPWSLDMPRERRRSGR